MSAKTSYPTLPEDKRAALRKAVRIEIWTLGFLASIVAVMYFIMGSSQAMKTAWIEDLLSLLPPSLFLLSAWAERKPPSERFPFGFHRVGSLGFFAAACALLVMGVFLLYESIATLVRAEHPTIGTVELFGETIWLGWLMMAGLAYSVISPVVLGRMKKQPAQNLSDKILSTDADMNAADWQTGLAGIAGIIGIGLGFWWADAAAALIISFSILKDGISNCKIALAELLDGAPRKLDADEIHPVAKTLREELRLRYPGHDVRLRETGRFIRATVVPSLDHEICDELRAALRGSDEAWRVTEVSHVLTDRLAAPQPKAPVI